MTDPATLLRSNRRRRVARRVAVVATIPLLVVALALGAKLLSMYAFAYSSAAAYAAGDYPGTTQAARGQKPLNFFEPYKAPFNVGVGLAASDDLAGARAAFEEALALATGLEQCAVRVNLAIVIERTGDLALAADDGGAARAAWQEALLVMMEAPEGCRTPEADDVSPDPDQNMTDTMDEEEQRLREKLQDSTAPTPPEDPDDSDPLEQSEIDNIAEQLEQGIEDVDDFDERETGEGGATGTDRPW